MRLPSTRAACVASGAMLAGLAIIAAASARDWGHFPPGRIATWWLVLIFSAVPYALVLWLFRSGRERAAWALGLGYAGPKLLEPLLMILWQQMLWHGHYGASTVLYAQSWPLALVLNLTIAANAVVGLRHGQGVRSTARGLALIVPAVVLGLALPFLVFKTAPAYYGILEKERLVISSLHQINAAQTAYVARYGRGGAGFAPSLRHLGVAPGAGDSAEAAGLIDDYLASGYKKGYRFSYLAGRDDGSGIASYAVVARPAAYGPDGIRSFYTDQTGVIRTTGEDRPATAKDPPLSA